MRPTRARPALGASRLAATWRVLGTGAGRHRRRALRDSRGALRLAVAAAGLHTGVLAALRSGGPAEVGSLAERTGVRDTTLLSAWLRVLQGGGYVASAGGRWFLAPRGAALLDDDVLAAVVASCTDWHTGLYRDLPGQLAGGPPRRDVAERGETIARLSGVQQPFLTDLLRGLVRRERPAYVLDIGCGAGGNLAAMLDAAPAARGLGVELDAGAADLAEGTLAERGLRERATVVRADVRDLLGSGATGGGYDVALWANAVYYVPLDERVEVIRDVTSLLSDRGVLVVVTTAAGSDLFSRHLDLLLRAQGSGMELPDVDELRDQLTLAGLRPEPPRRLVPGQPLLVVLARR